MTVINDQQAKQVTASTAASVEKVEGELRAFVRRDVSLHRNRSENGDRSTDLGLLVERMSGASIHEIERVMAELASVRDMLRSEAARVQRDLNAYTATSQAAMDSMKIVGDSLVKWKSQIPNLPQATTS